jgi:hypothetical protein
MLFHPTIVLLRPQRRCALSSIAMLTAPVLAAGADVLLWLGPATSNGRSGQSLLRSPIRAEGGVTPDCYLVGLGLILSQNRQL